MFGGAESMECRKVVWDGEGWCGVAPHYMGLYRLLLGGVWRCWVVRDRMWWSKVVLGGAEFCWMVSEVCGDAGWCHMIPDNVG